MDCTKFQNSISDYLEGSIESRLRAECAAHRLVCRECRELYSDVRATVQTLNSAAVREIDGPQGLGDRIIARTTAGEMLSCGDFDKLIERYFDGVILAPTFQTFSGHFDKCAKCRRLMAGIEEAIEMCREIKDSEVEVPESLHDRIVAATVGVNTERGWFRRAESSLHRFFGTWASKLWSPQMAVAALIFAASSLLVLSRFGSVSGMASHAESQAEVLVNQGQRAINQTGAMARTGFKRVSTEVNTLLFDGSISKPSVDPTTQSNPEQAGKPDPGSSQHNMSRNAPNKEQQERRNKKQTSKSEGQNNNR